MNFFLFLNLVHCAITSSEIYIYIYPLHKRKDNSIPIASLLLSLLTGELYTF